MAMIAVRVVSAEFRSRFSFCATGFESRFRHFIFLHNTYAWMIVAADLEIRETSFKALIESFLEVFS